MDQLRHILFSKIPTVRISDTFEQPEMATDCSNTTSKKLNMLRQRGAELFAKEKPTQEDFQLGDVRWQYPESQLETWTHSVLLQQSAATYQTIKGVIERKDAPYSSRRIRFVPARVVRQRYERLRRG